MTIDTIAGSLMPLIAQTETAPPPGGGMGFQILILGLMLAGMWFLIIAPQRKKQKELDAMIQALKPGDNVITTGGIHGSIASVRKDRLIVRIAENTKIEMSKNAIAVVVNKKGEKEESEAATEDKK